jgi:uncharacterized protein YcbK (DUF882 family)
MLNKYFNRSEFACKCGCGFDTVDAELLQHVTVVREYFNTPVRINSACRCESHNRKVGGSTGSLHKKGRAADITVDGVDPSKVVAFLDNVVSPGGLGEYKTFTHVDSRRGAARWVG